MPYPREPKIYYFPETQERRAVLIFDGGYEGGDIHIYEHKETLPDSELDAQIRKHGHPMSWKIIP